MWTISFLKAVENIDNYQGLIYILIIIFVIYLEIEEIIKREKTMQLRISGLRQ